MVSPGDLSVDFALARTVRDVATLLDAVRGSAPGDQYAIAAPSRPYTAELGQPPDGLRVTYVTNHLWDREIDPEVRHAAERAANLCDELGLYVETAEFKFDYDRFIAATVDVWCALIGASVRDAATGGRLEAALNKLEGHTRSWAEYGLGLGVNDLLAGMETLTEFSREAAAFMGNADILLSSTIPTVPIPLGLYDPVSEVAVDWYYASAIGNLESTTSLYNATGQPAISLPLFESRDRLPIGIHFAGRFGDEATLIRLAATLEEAVPWKDRTPTVHVSNPDPNSPQEV